MAIHSNKTGRQCAQWGVAVVDDDPAILDLLAHDFESAGLRCHSFTDAESLLSQCDFSTVGCFVLDIALPGTGGLELMAAIRKREPDVPVVVISGTSHISHAVCAFRRGANDFFEKPFDVSELIFAVRALGDQFIQKRVRRLAITSVLERLSAREREVMDALLAGMKTIQVGRSLKISPSTVEKHRLKIFEKTGVDSVINLMLLVDERNPSTLSLRQYSTSG